MTEENGLESSLVSESAINSDIFIIFLEGLRRRFHQRPLSLFMDQLQVHKAKAVQPAYERLNITPVFNVGYSPEFNPIEAVFSKVKYAFCRQRLNCLVNNIGFNADREISAALMSISQEHCAACTRKSLHLLEKAS